MSNTSKSKGNIYSLARLAKERLKENNYTKARGTVISNATTFANYLSTQKVVEAKKSKSNILSTNYDDDLYKKVCTIIESNNTLNPISMLIDREVFNTLDVEAKQYYISNLTKKYKFMRSRYFREHPVSLFV